MKNNNQLMFLLCFCLTAFPFVSADVRVSPVEMVLYSPLALILLAVFLIGAFFLIAWIIKKIKNNK